MRRRSDIDQYDLGTVEPCYWHKTINKITKTHKTRPIYDRDGTGSKSPNHRMNDFGRVGSGHDSRVSLSDPLCDQVLSFYKRGYRGVVSIE